jgi:RecB family endonuclease NucS
MAFQRIEINVEPTIEIYKHTFYRTLQLIRNHRNLFEHQIKLLQHENFITHHLLDFISFYSSLESRILHLHPENPEMEINLSSHRYLLELRNQYLATLIRPVGL